MGLRPKWNLHAPVPCWRTRVLVTGLCSKIGPYPAQLLFFPFSSPGCQNTAIQQFQNICLSLPQLFFFTSSPLLDFSLKPITPHIIKMAESSNGSNGGGGDEGVRPRNEVEAPRPEIDDQTAEGVSVSTGAGNLSSGDGDRSHAKEVGADGDRRRWKQRAHRSTTGFEGCCRGYRDHWQRPRWG